MSGTTSELTWRFGATAVQVKVVQEGHTWVLTAIGRHSVLVERDLSFARAAERLKSGIEKKIAAHKAARRALA